MPSAGNPRPDRTRSAAGVSLREPEAWDSAAGLRIGISGWTYRPWRGVFYPAELPHRRELEFASRQVNSIEINGSFYSLQLPSSYQRWHAEAPANFVFSVKGPRFITHMKKLREVQTPLANFFASGVLQLRKKLGPILWQFPPNFGWNAERFREFFEILPRDTAAAAKLSRKHDKRLKGRAWTRTDANRPLRYAVEIRHPTFMAPEFFDLLRQHQVAFVFADTAGKWPFAEELTSDFVYCRLHGAEELYVSGYTESAIEWWGDRIARWRRGTQPRTAKLITPVKPPVTPRDVYVYFDNDAKVHAPVDAKKLAARFGLQPIRFDTQRDCS